MLRLSLAASCSGDVTVRGITVTHGGMGALRDIASVYVLEDGRRLSRGRALSSRDGTVTLSLRPALVVPACGKKEIAIASDFAADAAVMGEHALALASPDGIDAQGASVALADEGVTAVLRTAGVEQGSVTAEFLPLLQRVTYGDRRTVARLRVTAEGGYDQEISAMTLTNDGSARDSDLQNLTLETARGEVLARSPSLDDHRAVFSLAAPLLLKSGEEKLLTVRASVRAGRRRTIDFLLEEAGDLIARRARSRR